MTALSDHVSLTITADTLGISRAGFGTPMILSHNAAWVERVRYYTDIDGVGLDFATSSPEYRAANAVFSQDPHPDRLAIGRAALKPTQVFVLGVATVTNARDYSVNVKGQGFVDATVTYTSDGSATNDEIAAGLVSALNGVASKNYTAAATGAGGSQVVTVTGNAAGNWFSLEVVDVTALSSKQTHSDPGLATDLDAINNAQPDWYVLLTNYNSQAYGVAAATWVEAHVKMYLADVSETAAILTVGGTGGTSDTLDALHTSAFGRTAGSYHPSPAAMMSAAWAGRVLPDDPGSDDWKWKTLATVPTVSVLETYRTNLVARQANTYQAITSDHNITWEGTVASGQFIDVTRSVDWLYDDMQKGVFGVLVGVEKVPFTDNGIALVENEVQASLDRAVANGILTNDPAPKVTAPRAKDVSSNNRGLRLLPDIKFSGQLAGSIHKVKITGNVTV